jgi:hypothetical protein
MERELGEWRRAGVFWRHHWNIVRGTLGELAFELVSCELIPRDKLKTQKRNANDESDAKTNHFLTNNKGKKVETA